MKKLVALFCAALFVLSLPTFALAEENNEASGGIETYYAVGGDMANRDLVEEDGDLVYTCSDSNLSWSGSTAGTIVTMKMVVTEGYTKAVGVGYPKSTTVSGPYDVDKSKTVLSAVGFTLSFTYPSSTAANEPPNGGSMEYTYQVNQPFVNNLAKSNGIDASNIQLFVYEKERRGSVQPLTSYLSATNPNDVKVSTSDLQAGTFVMALVCDTSLLDSKPVSPKPNTPAPTINSTSDDSSSDSSTWRDLQVTGSTEVSAQSYLFGANASDGDSAYLVVKRLSSGSAFNELRAAAGGDNLNKAFDVTLYVNGKEVHNDFGRVRISFAVGSQYDGRKATVWHLHNNGQLTSEDTWVVDGAVSVEASDLSEFGIDIEGVSAAATQVDDGATSPKTGQSIPAGTAAAALLVAGALGATAVAAARRRSMR